MKAIDRRLSALEVGAGIGGGWDYAKPCHAIIYGEEQTHAEGLAEYRARFPDKAINQDDNVIWIKLVSPKFDKSGAPIPQSKDEESKGPSLAEVMALKKEGENRIAPKG